MATTESEKAVTGNGAAGSATGPAVAPKPAEHAGIESADGERERRVREAAAAAGKREITEEECADELGFAFKESYKWWILTVIFLVQTSMNFNTSLYSNGLGGISDKFNVSEQAARVGAAIFLVFYAFGCELWAPWSEEFGRKPILQASLFLVNIWTIPVALAPNFGCLLVGRALGGLSSAGGSVTLGMIADMFDADHQQYAVAYIVFSSVGGSILGPIIGGFVEQYLAWEWTIWIQLIFGVFVQVLHLVTVPETRTTIMLDKIAKKRRKNGVDPNVYGPNEIDPVWDRLDFKEVMHTWLRPFRMFLTEPIVLTLSLLSGFSDALIFMSIQSFSLVYKQWGFNAYQIGLTFIPIGIGYVIAWLSFIPAIKRNIAARDRNPHDEHAQYESRLYWLLWTAPCLPIGLMIFAWTSGGPPIHWIGTMFGSALIGIANYAIYMATIDYMVFIPHFIYYTLDRTPKTNNCPLDLRLRSILSLGNWWQRMVARLPRRCPHGPRHPVLHQHRRRERKEPPVRLHHPRLHLLRPGDRRLRHLLEGARPPQALPVRPEPGLGRRREARRRRHPAREARQRRRAALGRVPLARRHRHRHAHQGPQGRRAPRLRRDLEAQLVLLEPQRREPQQQPQRQPQEQQRGCERPRRPRGRAPAACPVESDYHPFGTARFIDLCLILDLAKKHSPLLDSFWLR